MKIKHGDFRVFSIVLWLSILVCIACPCPSFAKTDESPGRLRARDFGIEVGILPTGPLNAITDVPGILVGHKTIDIGDDVRTGITAIIPFEGNIFRDKLPAAVFVGNGFGKAVGLSQIEELGTLETPIVLTNTLSVAEAMSALVEYTLKQPGNENVRSVNAVVAETNDGYLNNIRKRVIEKQDIFDAIYAAKGGRVEEGAVGAGRGTICLGFKGGIGTSSRIVKVGSEFYTVGVLVQTNFGGVLEILGAPVGRELGIHYMSGMVDKGSCIIVVATDAPCEMAAGITLLHSAFSGIFNQGKICRMRKFPVQNSIRYFLLFRKLRLKQYTIRCLWQKQHVDIKRGV